MQYAITVTDPEDGTIDCAKVKLTYILGHDNHGHPITTKTGCSGSITIPVDGEHDDAANIFAVFDAEYTDNAGLTTHAQNILQPKHRQAEHYSTLSGVTVADKTTAEGGKTISSIENGDWIAFEPYKLNTATTFNARVASGGSGGTLQIRAGSATGAVLGSVSVPGTGSWDTYTTVNGTLSGAPAGTTTLYLTFAGGSGSLFDLDAFTFNPGNTPTPGTGRIVGLAGKCLDVRNGSSADGALVQIASCSGSAGQQWTVTPGSTVKALNKCLDISGNSTANGARIQLWSCHGGANQNWQANADGSLRNPQSGKCLDVTGNNSADGTLVNLWTCNGGANQKWTLP